MTIEVKNVSKSFGRHKALDDVSLRVEDGKLVSLLGPSGSGKTTLLRIIAGLESFDDDGRGAVLFHDEDVSARRVEDRQVGFVFQHYALFKHMTVFENVAFGLRVRPAKLRPTNSEISDRVHGLLKLIQLDNFGNRYPAQLSGGQRQRVALARALAIEPRVMLLDEPFGALDAKVRQDLRRRLRELQAKLKMTTILVTHDQEEALEVSDEVVVMNQARIEQIGTPEDVFHRPANEFVIDFLGNVNVFHGRIERGRAILRGVAETRNEPTDATKVYVRPHELEIDRKSTEPGALQAKILRINPAGALTRIVLDDGAGREVQVDLPFERFVELGLKPGEAVFVAPRKARVFVPEYVI